MKSFLRSLLSRKFLLALGGFISAAAAGEWTVAMGILLGYLGVEGAADFKSRTPIYHETEIDTDSIVPAN